MVSEKKAKGELKAAREREQRSHSWQPYLAFIKLRAQLFSREVDEMLLAHQAHIPRVNLHGEGTVV